MKTAAQFRQRKFIGGKGGGWSACKISLMERRSIWCRHIAIIPFHLCFRFRKWRIGDLEQQQQETQIEIVSLWKKNVHFILFPNCMFSKIIFAINLGRMVLGPHVKASIHQLVEPNFSRSVHFSSSSLCSTLQRWEWKTKWNLQSTSWEPLPQLVGCNYKQQSSQFHSCNQIQQRRSHFESSNKCYGLHQWWCSLRQTSLE